MAAKSGLREHPAPKELLAFLDRVRVGPAYIRRTVAWIKETYPGSWDEMAPMLRKIYREESKAHPGK